MKPGNYRKEALKAYPKLCAYCSFGIEGVLEIAHLDQNRENNAIDNLAPMCPTCHKMHDIGLIPTKLVKEMRDHKREIDWKPRIKDAGQKAAQAKKMKATKAKNSAAGKKAWEARKLNALPKASK